LCEKLQITEPTEPKDVDEWIFDKCGKCSLLLGEIYFDIAIDELDTKAISEPWKKRYAEATELLKKHHSEAAYIAFKKAEAEERWKKEYADSAGLKKHHSEEAAYIAFKKPGDEELWKREYANSTTLLKKFHSEAAYIAFMGKWHREYVPKAILSKADRDTKFYIKEINRRLDRVKSGKWDVKDVKSLISCTEKLSPAGDSKGSGDKKVAAKSGGEQQKAGSNKADEQNIQQIILNEFQKKILKYLNEVRTFIALVDIQSETGISSKTVSNELKGLIQYGFAKHPDRKKYKIAITQHGTDYLTTL
jgi:hypothetical protein